MNLVSILAMLVLDAPSRSFASDFFAILIPFASGVVCFRYKKTMVGGKPSMRALPIVMGWISLIYGIGDILFVYETRVLHAPANPGWADIFYVLQYPLIIAAIAMWPSRPMTKAMRLRAWSDGLLVATSVFAFAWVYLIGPAIKATPGTRLGAVVSVAYPVLDTLIIFSLLQMIRKGFDPRFRLAAYLFMFGMVANIFGDVYYAFAAIDQTYHSGFWVDASWTINCAVTGLAGYLIKCRLSNPAFKEIRADAEVSVSQRNWTLYAPYVLVPATGLLVFQVSSGGVDPLIRNGLYVCALASVLALMIRQVLVVAENGSLYQRLRDAYGELELRSQQVAETATEAEHMNEQLRKMASMLEGQNKMLGEKNEALEQLATRDGMTGLANHRAFQERLREELAKATRQGHHLSLALVDVDFFKQYNDNYGHPAGDQVLRSIAKLLEESIRAGDLAARYGGEEFALLLPYSSRDESKAIVERIRETVAQFPFQHRRVTLSIGLCILDRDCSSCEAMIDHADRALYAAKSRGRNQVVDAAELQIGLGVQRQEPLKLAMDASTPMGYGAILAAGLDYHPEALGHEPQSALVAGLLATLELKDPMNRGSSLRVMWYAMRLAQQCKDMGILSFTPTETRSLGLGALLHDIGRLGIQESILTSPDKYSPEMRQEIEKHPAIGGELIRKFPGLAAAIPVISHHHERWDGSGYPCGLNGSSIPKGARILAYADALNAMSSVRPYATAREYEEIIGEFVRNAGSQFDPDLLPAFLAVPKEDWEELRSREPFGLGHQTRAA